MFRLAARTELRMYWFWNILALAISLVRDAGLFKEFPTVRKIWSLKISLLSTTTTSYLAAREVCTAISSSSNRSEKKRWCQPDFPDLRFTW